jgi:hypothetical protein
MYGVSYLFPLIAIWILLNDPAVTKEDVDTLKNDWLTDNASLPSHTLVLC